jgi:hypothetical protein
MTFLRTSDGCFVRLDRVREASPRSSRQVIVTMESGAELKVEPSEWERARWASEHHVVAAAPGTALLFPVRGCDRRWVVRQPVIGWAIGGRGFVDAITSTGVFRVEDNCPAFRNPDGTVEDALGHYDSYEDWLAQLDFEEA